MKSESSRFDRSLMIIIVGVAVTIGRFSQGTLKKKLEETFVCGKA